MKRSNTRRHFTTNFKLAVSSMAIVGFLASSVFAQQFYPQAAIVPNDFQHSIQGQVVYSKPDFSLAVPQPIPFSYPVYDGVQIENQIETPVISSYRPSSSYSSYPTEQIVDQSVSYSVPNPQPMIESYPSGTYANSIPSKGSQIFSSPQPATYTASNYVTQPVASNSYASPSVNSFNSNSSSTGSVSPGLAQQKAVQAAQMGIQGHLGSGLGGAKYEGVGWSNQSAQQAIQNCCYWGTRPTAQIGVSKAADGTWYACVLYH